MFDTWLESNKHRLVDPVEHPEIYHRYIELLQEAYQAGIADVHKEVENIARTSDSDELALAVDAINTLKE